jgi:hypothetical protein
MISLKLAKALKEAGYAQEDYSDHFLDDGYIYACPDTLEILDFLEKEKGIVNVQMNNYECLLMSEYNQEYLGKGKTRQEAFTNAVLRVLEDKK